jgi:hypothetical protein
MFNEVATEKRIRWDPKTNHFLGVCRQHAHRTSMEFINEGDLEELFRRLNSTFDDEKVHHAGEVRIWFHLEIDSALSQSIFRLQLADLAFCAKTIASIQVDPFLSLVIANARLAGNMHS